MSVYAVAQMRSVSVGPDIVKYLERIDATLAPFGGKFIVHGGKIEVVEGVWPGHLIVIAFPDRACACLVRIIRLSGDPAPAHRQFRKPRHHCRRRI